MDTPTDANLAALNSSRLSPTTGNAALAEMSGTAQRVKNSNIWSGLCHIARL